MTSQNQTIKELANLYLAWDAAFKADSKNDRKEFNALKRAAVKVGAPKATMGSVWLAQDVVEEAGGIVQYDEVNGGLLYEYEAMIDHDDYEDLCFFGAYDPLQDERDVKRATLAKFFFCQGVYEFSDAQGIDSPDGFGPYGYNGGVKELAQKVIA